MVKPGSATETIRYRSDGVFVVKLRARPVHGEANESLIDFLAGIFGLRKNEVLIEKGAANRRKVVRLFIRQVKFESIVEKISRSS